MKAFESNIRKVVPYVPGEQPKEKVIKLNTNENPYPPAPGVEEALKEVDMDALRRYPDPTSGILVKALAEFYEVKESQVFVGVGSDDVLAMCFLTFFNSEKPILFPDVSYSFYKVWAELYKIPYETPQLDKEFRIVGEDYYKENGGIIFPNPNAPTALYEDLTFIRDILEHNRDVIVIIDEAYVDFAGASALKLIEEYDNLLVVQTFSKARSMAGIRIGYAVGNERLVKYLNDAKYSFNSYTMNVPSLICGVAAVKDKAYFEYTTKQIIETREWTKLQMKELGFVYLDSSANFLLVRHSKVNAKELFEELKTVGIYVRYLGGERLKDYLRVSIGTKEEMTGLLSYLKAYLK